jgi:hypothetical protein
MFVHEHGMHYFVNWRRCALKTKEGNPKYPPSPSSFKISKRGLKFQNQKYVELPYLVRNLHN